MRKPVKYCQEFRVTNGPDVGVEVLACRNNITVTVGEKIRVRIAQLENTKLGDEKKEQHTTPDTPVSQECAPGLVAWRIFYYRWHMKVSVRACSAGSVVIFHADKVSLLQIFHTTINHLKL